ncbi:MAG TPA: hypothetical protein VFF65_11020, partial [Phycisphaerales bacterium]|nr:hypothetical protein [Phycisphaerales bacterium]
MRTRDFATRRFSPRLVVAAALCALGPSAAGQAPALIGAAGMPVVVNDPAATMLIVNGRPVAVRTTTIIDASPAYVGNAAPDWVWLAGTPGPLAWQEAPEPAPARSLRLRWFDALTKGEFEAARPAGPDGKPLATAEQGTRVWLDAVAPGWETLSRAALSVVREVPETERGALAAALRTPLATPEDHWRSALLLRAINPSTPAAADFQPAALNAVARQQGDMWAGAIGRLSRVDAGLALQVSRRLVLVGSLPTSDRNAVWTVLWCEADPRLLESLMTAPPASLAAVATSFLAGQPQALTWVRDDAGLRDPFSGSGLTTVGVLSLGDQTSIGGLAVGNRDFVQPTPLRPLSGVLLSAADGRPAAERRAAGGGVALASVKVGQNVMPLPVASSPAAAAPPGVLIGPFFHDWTLDSFRSQQTRIAPGVAGSLLPAGTGEGKAQGDWTLYLECRVDRGREVEPERLRVWVGPSGAPLAAIEVLPDGTVSPIGGRDSGIRPAAVVSRIPGGWCASVTLPAAVVDTAGTLRLAV